MKTIKLLLAIVTATTLNLKLGTLNCKAQTSIPAGNVSGTWTLAGSPYNIQGSIQILDGTTLTIQPGVTVNFQGTYKLNVQGRLIAIGSATDTIIFTATNTTNGWRGMRFDNTPITNDSSKIVYCKLQYGKATGSTPDDNGGALYFDNFSKVIVSNCHISNSMANFNGGGVWCNSSPVITYNIISNNIARNGGGLFCSGNATITNNNISYNTATSSNGGGIEGSYGSSPLIANNIISNNTAFFGGGVSLHGSNPTISNNTISNNTATDGGGIRSSSGSDPFIVNNTISNNNVSGNGGGVFCNSNNPMVTNNSIANNSASKGGALFCTGSNPSLQNCIFYGNTASTGGAQVYLNDESSDPNFYYCDVQGGSTAFELNGNSYSGTFQNNIDTDPLFVSPSGGSGTSFNGVIADWSLQVNSPCINSGDLGGTYPTTDIKGNPRVTVCRIDMGAYEYQNGIPFATSISQTQQNLCYGDSTASATIVVTGGIPTYTYLWSNGETTATASILKAATYTVTVTETSYACSITKTITINEPAALSLIPSTTNPVCTNNNGNASITVSGGTAPYSYLWSTNNNSTTDTISSLLAGTYSVTVTDTNGCSSFDSVTLVTQFPLLSIVSSSINPICTNNNGSAAITASGGTVPYTYLWSTNNNSTTDTISSLLAGTYSVTVTDTNGCSILDSVTLVTQFPLLSLVSSSINPICTNNNGSAAITANGGTTPYTYLWSTNNNSITDTISSLLAGTYSVAVTDSNGCSILDSVTLVTEFPSLSLVSSFTNASCYNNDGSASVIPNGGSEPYSYLWSNNSISQNLSGIGSGTYSVTTADTNGCVVSETFIINNSIAPISIPICMVTVDSSSTKNIIVWEKPTDAPIESFKIYREVASVYTLVGSVLYNEVSEFTDNANGINPNTTSYKYKLSVLDTCGNESSLSDIHRTIHVQISAAVPQGVNLNWNDYIGFTFSQYRILRDNLGNGNWQVIDSVSFGTTTYTSTDVLPNAQYIVEATRPTSCVSTRQIGTTRSSSKSNTASQTTGVNEVLNDLSLLISPNPSNGKFVIELSSSSISNNNKYSVKIYNVLGEQVYLSELKQLTRNEIDLSNVPKGIYFVNVYNGDKIYTRKIVKQ